MLTLGVEPSIQREGKILFLWITLDSPGQCLICLKTVAVLKEFIMRRHWEAEHRASNFGSMSPAERKYAIDRLSGNLQKTTSFFRKQTAEADTIVRASYDVSRILACWMKPFSEGDFIKECLVAVVDSVCPEQRSVFESVILSSPTVRRRIEDMSQLACVPDDVEPDTCVKAPLHYTIPSCGACRLPCTWVNRNV